MVSPGGGGVSEADRGADRQTSMPAEFLYNLTKNLTVHLQYNLCAVLPYIKSTFISLTVEYPIFLIGVYSERLFLAVQYEVKLIDIFHINFAKSID